MTFEPGPIEHKVTRESDGDRLLAGHPVPVIRGATAKKYGWQELADAYAARLDIKEDV